MAFVEQELTIAGSRLRYREQGAGEPLLFLHGAGGADSALAFLQPFTERLRVLVPDHPGFGQSGEAAWLDDIHDVAYAYLDFLDALDLRGVHLVGTSLGGWVALEIAVRSSHRLASLTLIGASGIRAGQIPIGDLFTWSAEERVRKLVADPALAAKILSIPQSPEQQAVAARNLRTTDKLARQPRFCDPGLEKWLHRIDVPTHVIWGDLDQLFPVEYGRRLASLIPCARFSTIPDCGHLPQVEQPAALEKLVRELA